MKKHIYCISILLLLVKFVLSQDYYYKDLIYYTTKIIEKFPKINIDIDTLARTYYTRGDAYLNLRKYDEAISDLTKAISLKKDFAEAYNNRGVAYMQKLNYFDAVNDFAEAANLNPNLDGVQNNLLIAYATEQIEEHTREIALDPNNIIFYLLRGYSYERLKDYDHAEKDYNAAIRIDPIDSRAYNDIAHLMCIKGEYEKGLTYANKAVGFDQKIKNNYETRGEIYYHIEQYTNCIDDMNKSISIKESGKAYYWRGLTKIKLGQKIDGCADLLKAKQIDDPDIEEIFSSVNIEKAIEQNCK